MKFVLQIKPEDCSLLGKEVLKHMEQHQKSMSELARQAGISQPGLRTACLKGTTPTESTLRKLAEVMDRRPLDLYHLVYEDKIRNAFEPDAMAFVLQLFENIYKALCNAVEELPEEKKPSEYKLLNIALKNTKSLESQEKLDQHC